MLTRDQHQVSRKNISKNALKVLYRLNQAGYQAYLVGGGVRDLLLGLRPKDFDVATDATPEQIKAEFRNCRLIGRRFRLAHILYGREIIEVATFRANHPEASVSNKKPSKRDLSRTSEQGMLVRDNVYGSLVDDAFRRDFTVNALYYRVTDFAILDYTGGLKDLDKRQLKFIGDPEERYREDPVRILRAIRLSCKINLQIETKTHAPIKQLAQLLTHVSSARLWDESNKMLLAGHAQATFNSLKQHGVAQYLFPLTIQSLNDTSSQAQNFNQFVQSALKNTDKRIADQQPVTPAFLFAVFLWQPLLEQIELFNHKGMPPYEARQKAASQVMTTQQQCIGIPKRFSMMAKEIWSLQFRLGVRRRKSVFSVIQHPRFRAAYDFLCLRAASDTELQELADWWTEFQILDDQDRNQMLQRTEKQLNPKNLKPKKKVNSKNKHRRSRTKTKSSNDNDAHG
ncbi:MAG: polynucleotide adenylyltransferase PcnB [Enterobacterales bacterium]|nr:polynucleotide adenylyltransferase PcnB [Enterobacterales bacterium]